jgi:CMP-N,N'-diacetyllegionaminic acid synthase
MNSQLSNVLALIPARGGSKGIPRKNLLNIAGKPLIAWSIVQALASKGINRVIVSTDDPEIMDVSKSYGAEVPFIRPKEFATDSATDLDVFTHALTWLRDNEGYIPDFVVHLRPTGPARVIGKIDEAIMKISSCPDADSLRSISQATHTPYKMWLLEDDKMRPALTMKDNKESHSIARQNLPIVYWQNGYVDIIRSSTILEKNSMVGDYVLPFIIPHSVHDIDYPEDIPIVEKNLQFILKNLRHELVDSDLRHSV